MNIYAESAIARLVYGKRKLFPLRRSPITSAGKAAILVIRPDAIGDLTLTVPFLRNLRANFPSHIITLVTDPSLVNLMELCPYIDELLTFSKRAKKHKFMTNLRAAEKFVREKLPPHKWELAIVPAYANPDSYCEAWISFFSGAKRRLAYTEVLSEQKHHDYMGAFDMYFTDLCRDDTVHHEVEGCLGLIRHMGLPVDDGHLELWTEEKDRETAKALLGQKEKQIRVAVNLSTSNITKDWPVKTLWPFARCLWHLATWNLCL